MAFASLYIFWLDSLPPKLFSFNLLLILLPDGARLICGLHSKVCPYFGDQSLRRRSFPRLCYVILWFYVMYYKFICIFYCIVLYILLFLSISIALLTAWAFQKRSRPQQLTLYRSLHAKALQATVSEGLAQTPYAASRTGFEAATLRSKCINSTNAPPVPTTPHVYTVGDNAGWYKEHIGYVLTRRLALYMLQVDKKSVYTYM